MVRSGSSYCSQSDLALTFGLGADKQATRVTVIWPSGIRQELGLLAAGEEYRIAETGSRPLTAPSPSASPARSSPNGASMTRR
jgi:hypothetical protein